VFFLYRAFFFIYRTKNIDLNGFMALFFHEFFSFILRKIRLLSIFSFYFSFLISFPMLHLPCFFGETAFSTSVCPTVPPADHLLSSKSILHESDYDQHVLNTVFLHISGTVSHAHVVSLLFYASSKTVALDVQYVS